MCHCGEWWGQMLVVVVVVVLAVAAALMLLQEADNCTECFTTAVQVQVLTITAAAAALAPTRALLWHTAWLLGLARIRADRAARVGPLTGIACTALITCARGAAFPRRYTHGCRLQQGSSADGGEAANVSGIV
jgi:hypothetical protein